MMPTLVMIPAFGCDERLYAPQAKALKKYIRIQMIIPSAPRYEDMVAETLAQIEGPFAVLGTSMGGRLALEIALADPDGLEALCVIGAGAGAVADPVAGHRRSSRIRGGERAQVVAEMAEMIAHMPGPNGPATKQAFINMGLAFEKETLARQSDALAGRVDRWDDVGDISCLTLCLWGAHDKFSPAADGLRLAHDVQEGGYTELPDCGHFPTLEYPDQATESIAAWLEDAGFI